MKLKKNIILLIIILSFIEILCVKSLAVDFDPTDIGAFTGETTTTSANVSSALGDALGVVQLIALAMAVIMLVVLGMKYMMASVSDRAEIKKHAVVYFVGAFLMFGASGIIQIIKEFTDDVLE